MGLELKALREKCRFVLSAPFIGTMEIYKKERRSSEFSDGLPGNFRAVRCRRSMKLPVVDGRCFLLGS